MRREIVTFNRGRVSRHALARLDVDRVVMSAEVQTNFLPRTLGAMDLRPGFEFLTRAAVRPVVIPFIYSTSDTARIELTPGSMRVLVDGATPVSRPVVATVVTNGSFTSDLSGWTDADDAGATSQWATGGYMSLQGTGYAAAIRRQSVGVVTANVQHTLRVVVERGPVQFRVGSSSGADDYIAETLLESGEHHLAFTPSTAAFHIEFSSTERYPVLVDSCRVAAGGDMTLGTPWTTPELCGLVRWCQLNDVVYVACDGVAPRRIERRANNSWSIVRHMPKDGPFMTENTKPITISASALTGELTLTASKRIFRRSNVGSLYRIRSVGQHIAALLADDGQYTDPIRVIGVGASREFKITIAGTWSGTLTLERSIGEPGAWTAVEDMSWVTNTTAEEYNDDLDNVVIYYRIGFAGNDHTSGSASVNIVYGGGSISAVTRITGYTSETQVSAIVFGQLGGAAASEIWAEGEWSERRGYPTSVALHEGRLWWLGRGKSWGSISDAFDRHDPDFVGDAGPINRYVGDGAVDKANWALPLQRLIVGLDSAEISLRSTSFDEVITPTNYNAKAASTLGSARVPAVRADKRGYFVQRSGASVYEVDYTIEQQDYGATDLTLLVPEIGEAGFVRIAVQRIPDTRIWGVRGDGTMAVLTRDAAEDVRGWVDVETNGEVVDVTVLPGTGEDRVFICVRRGGVWLHERLALRRECVGGAMNKQADSFVIYEGDTSVSTISGLDHLEMQSVAVWADGEDRGEARVIGGEVVLPAPFRSVCVGLPYEARYKSAKVLVPMRDGSSLTQRGRVRHVGLVMADTHCQGIEFGPDFDTMDPLPLMESETASSGVIADYDADMIEFPGGFETDSRLCLRARAPRPCTVLGAVLEIEKVGK